MSLKVLSLVVAGVIALCNGCAAETLTEHPVVKMAPFDLDCPKDQIHYTHLADGVWGVTGCGKRTKYIKTCRQVHNGFMVEDDCHWVQN